MKKFNKLFTNDTLVRVAGEAGYRKVKSIHDSRKLIEIDGLVGSFQRGHIAAFTNKSNVAMYPSIDDLYTTDACGSVYERKADANYFIGKLNGRSLKQFIADKDFSEMYS